ncbi:MAG: peroxiredoxin-like family protein [Alphaproteobacteria bacterium]
MLAEGPLVLIFFRFATCPACNIAIPHYSRNLAPRLRELGARLVAVSPQIPERLVDIKRKHDLDMTIATDWDNRLARHFGILYTYDEDSQRLALAGGAPIGEVTGTGTWELPMPTLDRDRPGRRREIRRCTPRLA